MKIAFIGYGKVGGSLALSLCELRHEVFLVKHKESSERLQELLQSESRLKAITADSAISEADLIFLATPFMMAKEALTPLEKYLEGKILVDCTNPVGPGLTHGLNNEESGTEYIQKLLPHTRVIKAFSIYGYENFKLHQYVNSPVKPVMMFCGNDDAAKQKVASLITEMGWEPLDVGAAHQALHLEHMTLLWVDYIRKSGKEPLLVWAAIRG